MNLFENFDWSIKSIGKVIGVFLLGALTLSIVLSMIGFSLRTIFTTPSNNQTVGYGGQSEKAYDSNEMTDSMMLSKSNIIPPTPDYSTGSDAENFEIKTYNATINTNRLIDTCATINALKSRTDVVFESTNQNENNCNFRFKVEKEKSEEILKIINDLNPDSIDENIQTIKDNIDGYNDQLDIYTKKLEAIEDTLLKAQDAYDEVSKLAVEKENVESMTNIINNKLTLIEKLTTERLNIKEQIDMYSRNKTRELDRLKYSFFNISIYKDQIFNWKELKNSWKYEFKSLITNFNEALQGMSVNLLTYMIRFVQVAIYFFISLFLLKFIWIITKKVWNRKA